MNRALIFIVCLSFFACQSSEKNSQEKEESRHGWSECKKKYYRYPTKNFHLLNKHDKQTENLVLYFPSAKHLHYIVLKGNLTDRTLRLYSLRYYLKGSEQNFQYVKSADSSDLDYESFESVLVGLKNFAIESKFDSLNKSKFLSVLRHRGARNNPFGVYYFDNHHNVSCSMLIKDESQTEQRILFDKVKELEAKYLSAYDSLIQQPVANEFGHYHPKCNYCDSMRELKEKG